MNENLNTLQNAINLLRGSLSRDEFFKGFKNIIEFVKKAENDLGSKIDNKLQLAENQLSDLNQVYQDTIKKIEEDSKTSLPKLKQFVFERVSDIFLKSTINNKLQDALGQVTEKLDELEQGLTELQAAPTVSNIAQEASKLVLSEVLPQIPTLDNLKSEITNLGSSIVSSLERLPEGEKLKIEAIEGLRKALDDMENRIRQKTGFTLFGGGPANGQGGRIVKSYDISSQLNGVLKVFSLPAMWRIISVSSSSFPNAFRQTTDWVYDANAHTLTFTSEITEATTLAAGQTITIIYSE